MKHKLIAFTTALALAAFSLCCFADTVHEVQRGETLFGIAYKYKVSVDDLQQWNPQARNGVKKGMKLVIKDGTEENAKREAKEANDKKNSTDKKKSWAKDVDREAASTHKEPDTSVRPLAEDVDTLSASDEGETLIEPTGNNILVLLPFAAESESVTRQAQYAADFYRGLLLAAKNLSDREGRNVEIIALDTNNDLALLESHLKDASNRDVAVIIAPDDDAQYSKIVEFASPRGIYVINPFIFKDQEQYASNPYVIHANISQSAMFAKAIDALLLDYAGFTPVILNPVGAKAEKEPFVNALKARCDSIGLAYETLSFEGSLDPALLESLAPAKEYLFIPKSGSLTIFNKFAPAIAKLKAQEGNQSRIALFGYPDWSAFRGESLVMLHQLQATIYSRFFYDEANPQTSAIQDQFMEWYGAPTFEVVPNQGVLGYDTGSFLIESMQKAPLGRALRGSEKRGVQSSFSFGDGEPGRGPANTALYIITFMPDNSTSVEII